MRPIGLIVAWLVAVGAGLQMATQSDLLTAVIRGGVVWLVTIVIWVIAAKAIDQVVKSETLAGARTRRREDARTDPSDPSELGARS
jgi:hypothetical protein